MDKQSDYIKELIRYTKEGCHIIDGKMTKDRVVGYLETILGRVESLEAQQHGIWERIENPYGELEGFICECGRQSDSASNYCSNCGRKMSGGEKRK